MLPQFTLSPGYRQRSSFPYRLRRAWIYVQPVRTHCQPGDGKILVAAQTTEGNARIHIAMSLLRDTCGSSQALCKADLSGRKSTKSFQYKLEFRIWSNPETIPCPDDCIKKNKLPSSFIQCYFCAIHFNFPQFLLEIFK
jgi:hypothetical protein